MKLSYRLAFLTKLNAALRRILLALWPEENKSWGQAFASESMAIDSSHQQLRWLLGGIPVLARPRFNSLLNSLRRPIGVGPSDLIEARPSQPGRRPRTPRLVQALLFLIFVWLFGQPATRFVFRSVSESYAAPGWDPERWPEVQRLQSLAQNSLVSKNPDRQLLAFVSLSYQDESKRLSMADCAMQADPSLSWIDYQPRFCPRTTQRNSMLWLPVASTGCSPPIPAMLSCTYFAPSLSSCRILRKTRKPIPKRFASPCGDLLLHATLAGWQPCKLLFPPRAMTFMTRNFFSWRKTSCFVIP
jgi:hypothetical protein